MEESILTVDVNAHIENLAAKVEISDSNATASISFDNLGYGKLKAIKLKATGRNAFGDVVVVDGSESFTLLVQDIDVEPNTHAASINAPLPDETIRSLEVEEQQVCLSDGRVIDYEGPDIRNIQLEAPITSEDDEGFLEAVNDQFSASFVNKPVELGDGWVCACGRYNSADMLDCSSCGANHEDLKEAFSEQAKEAVLASYEARKKEREEQRQAELAQQAAKKKKMIRIGVIAAVVIVILAIVAFFAASYMGKEHYPSEEAMKTAISTVYTQDSKRDPYKLKIDEGKVIWRISGASDVTHDITSYDYKNGRFEAGTDIFQVKSNGELVCETWGSNGTLFKRGGSWATGSSSSKKSSGNSSSTSVTSLKLSGSLASSSSNSSYRTYNGTIKNTGSRTFKFVKVKGSFKDKSGTVVDTDWTYAVGSEGLAPGESKTFTLSCKKNSSIKECTVSIIDYD